MSDTAFRLFGGIFTALRRKYFLSSEEKVFLFGLGKSRSISI